MKTNITTNLYKAVSYWNVAIFENEKYITTVSMKTKKYATACMNDTEWLEEQVKIGKILNK